VSEQVDVATRRLMEAIAHVARLKGDLRIAEADVERAAKKLQRVWKRTDANLQRQEG
jgi:hypothetical protein